MAPTIIITKSPKVAVGRAPAGADVAVIRMGVEGRPGPKGDKGDPGDGGPGGAREVYVQPAQPTAPGPWLWIQTGLAPGGAGFTFWFEDGI